LEAKNFKGIPLNATCYIRISHTPYIMRSFRFPVADRMEWKQSFFIPLCDPFFPIQLELVAVYNDGWITEHHKEEVICSSEILTPDIISLSKDSVLTLNLEMFFPEAKKKLMLKVLNIPEDKEKELFKNPVMKIKVKNFSSLKSYFVPPTRGYVEGLPMDRENYNKQHMKIGFRRVYRLYSQFLVFRNHLSNIYNWKYPVFSFFCFLVTLNEPIDPIVLHFCCAEIRCNHHDRGFPASSCHNLNL
jgi:hypothetical protein